MVPIELLKTTLTGEAGKKGEERVGEGKRRQES